AQGSGTSRCRRRRREAGARAHAWPPPARPRRRSNSRLSTLEKFQGCRVLRGRLRSGAMLELLAAGAALAGRALLQAADTALLAVGEDEIRALEEQHPHRVRWLIELKREPETTAAALRGVSSALLAFAAVACAIVVGDILLRAGVH